MFYDCLFSAACQREYLPVPLQAPSCPRPTEDREAGAVEREGMLGHRLARPSRVTLRTIFFSWEARSHLEEGGPSPLVLLGLLRLQVRRPVPDCPRILSVGKRDPGLWGAPAAPWLLGHPF